MAKFELHISYKEFKHIEEIIINENIKNYPIEDIQEAIGLGLGFSSYSSVNYIFNIFRSNAVCITDEPFEKYLQATNPNSLVERNLSNVVGRLLLEDITKNNTDLTVFGVGLDISSPIYNNRRETHDEIYKRFESERRALLTEPEINSFVSILDSIQNIEKIKSCTTEIKRVVNYLLSLGMISISNDAGRIKYGIIISAAIQCGFTYEQNERIENTLLNASKRSLDKLTRGHKKT